MEGNLFLAVAHTERCPNEALFHLFTTGEDYLACHSFNGRSYLGKKLPLSLSYEQLLDHKKHIGSLLKRLFPSHSFSSDDFVLISHYESLL